MQPAAHSAPAPIPDGSLEQARQDFLDAGHTLENVRRDFPEWHRGRPRYLLWALDVDLPPVRVQVAQAARHLDGLLLGGYVRQPHITLALCGFPADTAQADDDFGAGHLADQLDALRRAACPPLELEIGRLASFSSAPFLAVRDSGPGLARLRQALAGEARPAGGPYLPHVTVGLYKGRWPSPEIQARLDSHEGTLHPCRLTRLSLMSYTASEIGGPLRIVADYDLASGTLRWTDAPLREQLASRPRAPA